MDTFKLINISSSTSDSSKDKYLLSGLLVSSFNISNFVVMNTSNPIAFLLSSSLYAYGGVISYANVFSQFNEPISITDGTLMFVNYYITNVSINS